MNPSSSLSHEVPGMNDDKQSSLAHLHALRGHELGVVIGCLRKQNLSAPNIRLLEIGAGTGAQAREMEDRGFCVSAIDIAESNYSDARIWPVLDYDGRQIPFPDQHFDVVFSSNVLEHVPHAAELQQEIRRVLKDTGRAVHVLPSVQWRFWTNVSYYAHVVRVLWHIRAAKAAIVRRQSSETGAAQWKSWVRAVFPPRHGEKGNWLTELWYFSQPRWSGFFRANGWDIVSVEGCGLFYTGNSVLASSLSISARQVLATVLGAATNVFVLRKRGSRTSG